MVLRLWTSELGRSNESKERPLFCWRETSPFIYKGDAFTSERVRVRMLLGSVAHAGEYKIMVGAYNTVDVTVEMLDAYGRSCYLF